MNTAAVKPSIDSLLTIDAEYTSPASVFAACKQKHWEYECKRALDFPEAFWGDYARNFPG